MPHEDLLSIEDAQHQKLFYRFTPPMFMSNFSPLVIIFDANTLNFEYKMWNVLTPLYTFENENRSIYENLLLKLIKQISQEYECEEYIYLCAIMEENQNIEHFVEQCKTAGINIQLHFCPHLDEDGLKKVLDRLERMRP